MIMYECVFNVLKLLFETGIGMVTAAHRDTTSMTSTAVITAGATDTADINHRKSNIFFMRQYH